MPLLSCAWHRAGRCADESVPVQLRMLSSQPSADRVLHAGAGEETAAQYYHRGHQPMAANKKGSLARAQWRLIECDCGDMRHCAAQVS